MAAPFNVVVYPLTVYVAPTGTTFPAIDDDETGFDPLWKKLGTAGAHDYDDSGVTTSHAGTTETFSGAISTVARKAFRTTEEFKLGFNLVDLSPEQYALIMDRAGITTVAVGVGVAGEKSFSVLRGITVETYALLARGLSTVEDSQNYQIEVAVCYQSGDPAPVFAKGAPAMLAVEFTAMEVVPGQFVEVRVGTAPAT